MIIKNKFNKTGVLAISQIFILVIGIIAISYAIGSEVRVVSGSDTEAELKRAKEVIKILQKGNTPTPIKTHDAFRMSTPEQRKKIVERIEKEMPKGSPGFKLGEGFLGHLAEGVMWAGGVFLMIRMIGGFLPDDYERIANALSWASAGGIIAGKGLYGAGLKGGLFGGKWSTLGLGATGAGIVIGAIIFLFVYGDESQEIITYTSYVWDAPVGGENCHLCNEQGILPCSEYQCRSLGQSCELVNPGTDEEKCVWVNRNDIEFPTITPWEDALLNDDYKYTPDNRISPPDIGVEIINRTGDKCIPAFTALTFGIETNEPAKCKIDYLRKKNFDEMDFYFGGSSLLKEQHKQSMSLPGSSALEAEGIEIKNNGNYDIYVRCQDANGNVNTANFVFKFCVDKGPDTTPPLIVSTSFLNDMPIAYNQTSLDLEVYVNEPAECKWSHRDQAYDNMEEDMSCSTSVFEMNAQMLYKCSTTLTGLKDRIENKFYFRCKDQPGADEADRNVNTESYKFNLIGTQPLVIDSIEPENGSVVKDATESVKVTLEVKTSAGYKEGEAICYYSETGEEKDYVMFFDTNSYQHSQDLYLGGGSYDYFIKCLDAGGNTDYSSTSFSVESDSSAPIVVRVYHEETYLKLVTSEEGECVYDSTDCSYLFEDGISMSVVDKTNHFTDWNSKTNFYIKCQDSYGNQPFPNECSIIVRPFEI